MRKDGNPIDRIPGPVSHSFINDDSKTGFGKDVRNTCKTVFREDSHITIEIGALLHDVGKIGVPDAVLRKPGPLELGEILQIQEHPAKGKHILDNIGYLEQALPCVLHHHERFDGQGYPEKIGGETIPLPGRIISVADAFDAMTSDRPYRKKRDYQSAFQEIQKNAGKQFDPQIVDAFGKLLRSGEIERLIKRKKKQFT